MAYPTYPTMPTYGNYIPPQAQNLLSSGQMSQEQFNNLSNMANTFFNTFGR